ncbi:hypothetical protein ASF40_20705 [Microbacterium sp. Leaf288]|uniref:nuclear transport factor 2 family protein n=1 Tax=Microbacterium sp. Leaf288 TaxID=1736323 RepID=UPI0006FF621F|nr:nuclear transport factor 2 family protein [Microbacterium sp. Leaf288]KQP72779.1 hypothetical protein ASF40_20705 [Microbacterium sp. Leaf288]
MTAKETVLTAVDSLFVEKNPAAVDEYFGPTYIQHSTLAADGVEGLRALATTLPAGFGYQLVRVIAEGDLVVLHGIYSGFGADRLVAFDVFRVDGNRVVEHWDSLVPVVSRTTSGRSQIDGPEAASDAEQTAANKALVADFAQKVLVEADYTALTDYISTQTYAQHNPDAADGLEGFGAAASAWAADGKLLTYKKVHQIVAEGDFVFTRAEGEFGEPVIYNDLWRVEDGKIVEHWDVIAPIPGELQHTNGVF